MKGVKMALGFSIDEMKFTRVEARAIRNIIAWGSARSLIDYGETFDMIEKLENARVKGELSFINDVINQCNTEHKAINLIESETREQELALDKDCVKLSDVDVTNCAPSAAKTAN